MKCKKQYLRFEPTLNHKNDGDNIFWNLAQEHSKYKKEIIEKLFKETETGIHDDKDFTNCVKQDQRDLSSSLSADKIMLTRWDVSYCL